MDYPIPFPASKDGETTPSALDKMKHDSQRAVASISSNVMKDCSTPFPQPYSTLPSPLANEHNTVSLPATTHPNRAGFQFNDVNLKDGSLAGEVTLFSIEAELRSIIGWTSPVSECSRSDLVSNNITGIQMYASNLMQQASPPPESCLAISELGISPYGDTHSTAPRRITNEAQAFIAVPLVGEELLLPRRRLVVMKELTKTDLGRSVSGIRLTRKNIEKYFSHIPDAMTEFPATMHDGVAENKTWEMWWTISHKRAKTSTTVQNKYTLKGTSEYLNHHSLEEGDWLKIYLDESSFQCILAFEKKITPCVPPSHLPNLLGKTWKLIIRKTLVKSDCPPAGRKVLGSVTLERAKVEECLPAISDGRQGSQIEFYDWKLNRIWTMTLKFSSHVNGRICRLAHVAEFIRLHDLDVDDCLDVLKSDGPDACFALRALKLDQL